MNKSGKTYFQKHFLKIFFESLFNSAVSGLMVGLFCGFVTALITWLTPLEGFTLSIIVTAASFVVAAVIFYLAKFRPTVIRSARRIDSVGLEERLITMVEYENDTSPIAEIQRNDAKKALEALSTAAINLRVATKTLVTLSIALALCAVMLTINILADNGIIPDGSVIIEVCVVAVVCSVVVVCSVAMSALQPDKLIAQAKITSASEAKNNLFIKFSVLLGDFYLKERIVSRFPDISKAKRVYLRTSLFNFKSYPALL